MINVPTPVEYDPHPPTSVLLLLPFALFPSQAATFIWGFCFLAAYVVTGWLLLKEMGWHSLKGIALFVVCSALWPPLRYAFVGLTFEPVLLLFLTAAWLLERQGHSRWAGFLIGLAGLLKLWPAALLLGAGIQRRWRLVSAAALTLVTGLLITLLTPGPQAYLAYFGPVQANEQAWIPGEINLSLVGVIARLFTGYHEPTYVIPPLVHGVTLAEAVLVGEAVAGLFLIALLLVLWWCGRERDTKPAKLLSFGTLLTGLLLVFPAIWYGSMIFLLLPCAMTILAQRQMPRPPVWWSLTVEGALLLPFGGAWLIAQYAGNLLQGSSTGLTGLETLLFDLPTAALLLLVFLQAWLLWRASKRPTSNKEPPASSKTDTAPAVAAPIR